MALHKKAKTTKSKARKAKATKAKVGKASVKMAKAKKAKPAVGPAAAPPAKRDAKVLLEHLDLLHSLNEGDIKTIRDCCTATLEYRDLFRTESVDATLTHKASEYCYTKSGASSNVSIWKNGFKVEKTTQADAEARGIRPCG
ncbi:hypothetical protein ACVIWV_007695 [Bradyrhizobium diazoefficiens]